MIVERPKSKKDIQWIAIMGVASLAFYSVGVSTENSNELALRDYTVNTLIPNINDKLDTINYNQIIICEDQKIKCIVSLNSHKP